MKPKKKLGIGWSFLLLSLAITMIELFIPKGTQGVCLFFALMTWNVWLFSAHIVPFIQRKVQQREVRKQRAEAMKYAKEVNRPMELALMLHVNLRITESLHAIYPKATWSWVNDDPKQIVLNNGIGRIRVSGAGDYNFADIQIERTGTINCSMVQEMPELMLPAKAEGQYPIKRPLNPQIWYEQQGRTILQNVITDLHSRGHAALTVSEDGSILIEENEEAVTYRRLADFPTRKYWDQLVQVFQKDGLAAKIEPKGLQLTW